MLSECMSGSRAARRLEVGVCTAEAHRGQGLATLTSAAFLAACLDEGWDPCWTCFADNEGSVRLAEGLGFVRPADFPVWAWALPNPT